MPRWVDRFWGIHQIHRKRTFPLASFDKRNSEKRTFSFWVGMAGSVSILLVYFLDSLTTWMFLGKGIETNPLVNFFSMDRYILFTAFRFFLALGILWFFLPRSLQPTWSHPGFFQVFLIPLPYQKKIFLLPFYCLFYLLFIKIFAALSNTMVAFYGEPLLKTWSGSKTTLEFFLVWGGVVLLSHLSAQGTLYLLWKKEGKGTFVEGNEMA